MVQKEEFIAQPLSFVSLDQFCCSCIIEKWRKSIFFLKKRKRKKKREDRKKREKRKNGKERKEKRQYEEKSS